MAAPNRDPQTLRRRIVDVELELGAAIRENKDEETLKALTEKLVILRIQEEETNAPPPQEPE